MTVSGWHSLKWASQPARMFMRVVIEQLNLRPLQLTFDDFAAVEHLCSGSAHLVANEKRCMAFGQIHL